MVRQGLTPRIDIAADEGPGLAESGCSAETDGLWYGCVAMSRRWDTSVIPQALVRAAPPEEQLDMTLKKLDTCHRLAPDASLRVLGVRSGQSADAVVIPARTAKTCSLVWRPGEGVMWTAEATALYCATTPGSCTTTPCECKRASDRRLELRTAQGRRCWACAEAGHEHSFRVSALAEKMEGTGLRVSEKERVRSDWYCKDCTVKWGSQKGKRVCNLGIHLHCKQCQMHKRNVFGGNKESGPPSKHSTTKAAPTTPWETKRVIQQLEANITELRAQLRERQLPLQSCSEQVEPTVEVDDQDDDSLDRQLAVLDTKLQKLPEALVKEIPELANARKELVAQRDKLQLERRERKPVGVQINEVNRKLYQLDQKIQKAEAAADQRQTQLKLLQEAIEEDQTNLVTSYLGKWMRPLGYQTWWWNQRYLQIPFLVSVRTPELSASLDCLLGLTMMEIRLLMFCRRENMGQVKVACQYQAYRYIVIPVAGWLTTVNVTGAGSLIGYLSQEPEGKVFAIGCYPYKDRFEA
ncbi:unnamed protein product [Prorocentrum cordatum]|uniref:Uncharacterized protein n=1 Tax=Prorocentrum cordatum TaxID=2364126 RepID=A0ABN9X4W3_9DINO|nr:unnamed protein product [Polarella glacialis]